MSSSVRTRLTIWYTAAMTITLIGLAATTYFILKRDVIHRADTNAGELADSFLSTVQAEISNAPNNKVREAVAAAIAEHRFGDVVFVVSDAQGNFLGVSDSYERLNRADPARAVLSTELRKLTDSADKSRTLRIGSRQYRSYERHFSMEGQSAVLLVLRSLHRENEFLESLVGTFAIILPLSILLVGAGGYFLARRSLSPVAAMSAQAGSISSSNLHARLSVRNPRDELGQLASAFNGLLDRLTQALEQQRRFVADASHELRTPVAILCGEAEVTLAKENRSPAEYRESLDILHAEARRLRHIVEDLFTLARADAGQFPLTANDFYLDELISECARSVRTLASAKHITVSCESLRELPIRADENLLRRMVLNLIDNAIKYTPEGGSVWLQCAWEDGNYRFAVKDSGYGIPAGLQPRIFERFFRVDTARSRSPSGGGGAGLGLAIASWIAAAHGGRLELTQSSEQGSVFSAILPKRPPND